MGSKTDPCGVSETRHTRCPLTSVSPTGLMEGRKQLMGLTPTGLKPSFTTGAAYFLSSFLWTRRSSHVVFSLCAVQQITQVKGQRSFCTHAHTQTQTTWPQRISMLIICTHALLLLPLLKLHSAPPVELAPTRDSTRKRKWCSAALHS